MLLVANKDISMLLYMNIYCVCVCVFTCSQFDMFQGCVLVLMNPLPIALEEDLQRRSSSAAKLDWIAFDDVSVIRLLKEARQGSR